jgi:hypothetical protein
MSLITFFVSSKLSLRIRFVLAGGVLLVSFVLLTYMFSMIQDKPSGPARTIAPSEWQKEADE